MMPTQFALEAFDADTSPASTGPSDDYDAGFAAGHAAGLQEAAQAADNLKHELVQSLTEMDFTYREARQDILVSLALLLEGLARTVLPHTVSHGLAHQLADLIMARFAPALGAPVIVHVHPEQLAAVRLAIAQISPHVSVAGDPTLSLHAAWIGQGQSETYLDMDQHLADIAALIANLLPQDQRSVKHG